MIKETVVEKVGVEFYMLFDDNTWDTTIINVPKYLVDQFNETQCPNSLTGWVYTNEKFSGSVCLIGIYSVKPMEETEWA